MEARLPYEQMSVTTVDGDCEGACYPAHDGSGISTILALALASLLLGVTIFNHVPQVCGPWA